MLNEPMTPLKPAPLVMYDRAVSVGRFAPRPEMPGGPVETLPEPVFGPPLWVRKERKRQAARTTPADKSPKEEA